MSAKQRVFNYLASGRVHPALLFTGPDRAPKLEVAMGVAKFHLCQHKTAGTFCGKCSSCTRIDKGLHPDVLIYGAANLEAGAEEEEEEHIKVESIREITHHMGISPMEGNKKICIVDEANRMNVAASNAFLKTLEEPLEGRFFILLTTQPGKLLPTVLSRCIQFTFSPEQEILSWEAEQEKEFKRILDEEAYSELSEKDDILAFLKYFLSQLRDRELKLQSGESPVFLPHMSSHQVTRFFEEGIQLEGRLRSNASSSLMLESYLKCIPRK